MDAVYQFLHEWAVCGLLVCVGLLILIGISRARKSAVEAETDGNPLTGGDQSRSQEEYENAGILPAPVCVDVLTEPDEQAELLKAYATLGAKKELSVEEEYEYARLSELLARNYICIGHPAVD